MTVFTPVKAKLEEARALYRQDRLMQAQGIYGQILEKEPRHFEALHVSGIIAARAGDPGRAVQLIGAAIRIDPTEAAAHCNLGLALQEMEEWDAALASFDRAIAVQRDFAGAHFNRGNLLRKLRRFEEALASYHAALTVKPDFAEAHCNLGVVLRELSRWAAALASYDRALALKPEHAEAHCNRGDVLKELGRWDAALASCDRALALNPRYAQAHYNRGLILRRLDRCADALVDYDRALALKPDYAEAHRSRGVVLQDLGRTEDALVSYERALALEPDHADAHAGCGTALQELSLLPAALASYDRALALRPDLAESRVNRSLALLAIGDFERGWAEYEWRWRDEGSALARDRRPFSQPLWLGAERLSGKRILLYHEQGLGDTVQFCRYAAQVARLGAEVILEVPGALRNLLEGLDGVSHLAVRGEALPPFDYQCPLLSLPLALKTTLATVPGREPYLRSDARRVRYWTEKLGPRDRPRVGLVWSGGVLSGRPERRAWNQRRNIALAKLEPLAHAGIDFYSLQKGEPAESELAHVLAGGWQGPRLRDHTRELRDFADTAALIGQLDLVISVDTSTAHVAGALGKPVWLLNRYDTCWRWLLDRDDSPWYPTLRLYRQERRGEWEPVVERVRADLQRWVRAAS